MIPLPSNCLKSRQSCVLFFPPIILQSLTSMGSMQLSSSVALERGPGAMFLKQSYKQPSCSYLPLCLIVPCLSPLKVLWHTPHCLVTLPTAGVGLTFAQVLNQLPPTFLLSCFQCEVIAVYSPVLLSLCIKKKYLCCLCIKKKYLWF